MEKRILNQNRTFRGKKLAKKKGRFIGLSFSLCWMLICSFLLTFSCGAEEIFDLGKIVITATRIPLLLKDAPGSVSIISEDEVKSSQAENVGEVLEKVAGVKIQSYGLNGMSTLSFRGSSANQVLVMIDSRPINLGSTGSVDLSLYPLDDVEKIEVVRGPFSALYGTGALGGVVNIITKNPPQTTTTRAGLSLGTFKLSSYTLSYGSSWKKIDYLFTAKGTYSDGDRENNWKDSRYFSGKIVYPGSFTSFIFSGGYSQEEKGVPGSLDFPTLKASQKDERGWIDLTWNWKAKNSNFSLKGFLNQDETIYENPEAWGGAQRDTTENRVWGINFQHSFPFSFKHNFIWGVDWKEDEVDVKTAEGVSQIGGERQVGSTALYLQDELKFSPEFTVFLGTRYDDHSVYGSRMSPRLSFIYHLRKSTSLRASWGQAFRSPSIDDLYWQEDWGGGMGLFGNPGLKPEVSSEYEVGVEQIFTPQILGRMTFFFSEVDNLINWTETGTWRWEAQNVDKASIKGLEGEVRLKPWEKLSLSLNYTYLVAKDEKEFKGNFLPYRPQNKLFSCLDYKIRSNLHFHLEGELVGERYTNRENTEKLPSYTLLGARITFNLGKKAKVFLKADNLLDEEYEDMKGYPMPGTSFKTGIEIIL